MSILQQFMEAVEYRINDAWEHQWRSYENGQVLGYVNGFAAMKIVFNRETQEVIELTATTELDSEHDYAYRWINPDYKDAIFNEAESRNVAKDEAWEGFSYVDLELVEDLLEKGVAMLKNEDFDKRVQIPLDLEDDVLLELFKQAHARDITLNQLMEEALLKVIAEAQPKNSSE